MVRGAAFERPVRNPSTRATWRGDPVSGSIDTSPWEPSVRFSRTTDNGGRATVPAARRWSTSAERPSRRGAEDRPALGPRGRPAPPPGRGGGGRRGGRAPGG